MGTPPQTVALLLDTGSANIWMCGHNTSTTSSFCKTHRQYDHDHSSTFLENGTEIQLQYGSGYVHGTQSSDTFEISGLVAKRQTFTEIDSAHGYGFVKFDGILGIGWAGLSQQGVTPLFDNLGIESFSFFLASDGNETDYGTQSVMTLNGVDERFFAPPLVYYPLLREDFWVVQLVAIRVGGKIVTDCGSVSGGCKVIFDTGTSWISGPRSLLGKAQTATLPKTDCSNVPILPDVSFELKDGTEWSLTPEEYTNVAYIPALQSNVCQSGFEVAPDTAAESDSADDPTLKNTVVLGDSFLRVYYSHYDRKGKRMGLAHVQY